MKRVILMSLIILFIFSSNQHEIFASQNSEASTDILGNVIEWEYDGLSFEDKELPEESEETTVETIVETIVETTTKAKESSFSNETETTKTDYKSESESKLGLILKISILAIAVIIIGILIIKFIL